MVLTPKGARARAARLRRGEPPGGDHGAIAVIVAVTCTVIFALTAIVIDLGLAQDNRRSAQNAADSSALAGALRLSLQGTPAEADEVVKRYAASNLGVTAGEWANCSDPDGYAPLSGTPCITHDTTRRVVRVLIPTRTSPVLFGGFVGSDGTSVSAVAEASYGSSPADCGLCVLDSLNGQVGDILVSNGNVLAGSIQFNNAGGTITATNGSIGYSSTWDGSGTFDPAPPVLVPPFEDPFAALPLPPTPLPGARAQGSGPCTPGAYTDVSNCVSFQSGIYYITGDTDLTGNNSKVANDVLFYLTCGTPAGKVKKNDPVAPRPCNPGEEGGSITGAGKGGIQVNALQGGTYAGFGVIVDRNNAAEQKWSGNGLLVVNGNVYAANTTQGYNTKGNGDLTVNGKLVLGTLDMAGNGNDKLHIRVNAPPGTTTNLPGDVHLVR